MRKVDGPETWWEGLGVRAKKDTAAIGWLTEGAERLSWTALDGSDQEKLSKRWRFMRHRGDV
jgi:hypothetical protein